MLCMWVRFIHQKQKAFESSKSRWLWVSVSSKLYLCKNSVTIQTLQSMVVFPFIDCRNARIFKMPFAAIPANRSQNRYSKNHILSISNTKARVGHQDPTTGDYLEFRRMNKQVVVMTIIMTNLEPETSCTGIVLIKLNLVHGSGTRERSKTC